MILHYMQTDSFNHTPVPSEVGVKLKKKKKSSPLSNTSHSPHYREKETVRFIPVLKWGVLIWLDFQVRSLHERGMQNNLRKRSMGAWTDQV